MVVLDEIASTLSAVVCSSSLRTVSFRMVAMRSPRRMLAQSQQSKQVSLDSADEGVVGGVDLLKIPKVHVRHVDQQLGVGDRLSRGDCHRIDRSEICVAAGL